MKKCSKCGEDKDEGEFRRIGKGFWSSCKPCQNLGRSLRRGKSNIAKAKSGDELLAQGKDEIKQIVMLMIDRPKIKLKEIAKETGLSVDVVRYHQGHNKFLVMLRLAAGQRITGMVPSALKAMRDSLGSKQPDTKYRASVKVLENEGVLGGQRIDVHHYDEGKTREEKLEILRRLGRVPERTIIDAKVIE